MGFRSNFITEYMAGILVPEWFVEKYPDLYVHKDCEGNRCLPIIQAWESKFYSALAETEIFQDIQRILGETENKNWKPKVILVLLHECGGITRVEITEDSIRGNEPTEWKKVDRVEHQYCYNCSEITEESKP